APTAPPWPSPEGYGLGDLFRPARLLVSWLHCASCCHLGLLGGFSKADIYGAGHWARVPLTILQPTGWILMGGVIV
ncbi:MAG: hypothetical protein ACK5RU_00020, partial [Hyphomonadaceae bacterium]